MNVWADEDRRHFRIILSPEKGAELGDLKPYTRAVMERAEAVLGGRLEWIAIDHHDTDNPHTHIVMRGRHANGRALILPRDFVKAGLRNIARDVATEGLGPRTRADEHKALMRETRAHRPTRLDALIARQLEGDRLRIASIEAPNGDPALTKALKARARELERLGLASAPRRNVLLFRSDWRERLGAMELHLDVRKRLVLERSQQQWRDVAKSIPGPSLQPGPDR
ncbi:MAG: relaxase/mobilization nuclease domain-containing protein [Hyphomonadaceae bacterium]|nr:relaxase/mobilization nuclease domain-containing protein [Hyphomonadaceae bacterium]